VLVLISEVCQSTAPKPVAVPLLDIVPAIFNVAPEGSVTVSPESDICSAVPVAGETLFVFTSSVTVNPTPVGTVTVSPEVPTVKAVPD